MARTKRAKPFKNLTNKEKKFVERNKYKHGVLTKANIYELEFTQSAKKEEKDIKHKKQRNFSKKEIKDQTQE
jgi:hypothetical protein